MFSTGQGGGKVQHRSKIPTVKGAGRSRDPHTGLVNLPIVDAASVDAQKYGESTYRLTV